MVVGAALFNLSLAAFAIHRLACNHLTFLPHVLHSWKIFVSQPNRITLLLSPICQTGGLEGSKKTMSRHHSAVTYSAKHSVVPFIIIWVSNKYS
jgi:hypothetical protein